MSDTLIKVELSEAISLPVPILSETGGSNPLQKILPKFKAQHGDKLI